jgi:hypothetical protein
LGDAPILILTKDGLPGKDIDNKPFVNMEYFNLVVED